MSDGVAMKRGAAVAALTAVFSGLGATVCADVASARPSSSPRVAADRPNPDAIPWNAHCDLEEGRRLITDGSILLEARYLPDVPVPEKSLPSQAAQRLLQSETDHEFALKDLERTAADGHYLSPKGIQLNRKYVELLRGSGLKGTLRFRAKGANDPVLILDGKKVVGVVMPMKKT